MRLLYPEKPMIARDSQKKSKEAAEFSNTFVCKFKKMSARSLLPYRSCLDHISKKDDFFGNEATKKSIMTIICCLILLKMVSRIPNKKGASQRTLPFYGSDDSQLVLIAHTREALAAVYRTVGLGLERHTSLTTAHSAGSGEILAGTAGRILAGVAAGLAALRLVLEATLSVEFLLTGSEHEFVSAFLAHKSLVFKHFFTLSF
jgi:hypothetical protein